MHTYYQDAFEGLKTIVGNSRHSLALERLITELAPRPKALDLADKHGFWSDHPELESGRSISAEAWAYEIACEGTRLGYWDWVCHQLDLGQGESGDPAT
jgi:hypothetical protein